MSEREYAEYLLAIESSATLRALESRFAALTAEDEIEDYRLPGWDNVG